MAAFFQVVSFSCFAQFPNLHFQNITTANGLSSDEITCFYQDHSGFLWIGTKFGLNKYDGNQFQTFYHDENDSNSLSGNQIVDVLEDKQHILWIATKDGGLTRYDPSQPTGKQFRQFIHNPADSNSIFTNRLNCLFDYNDDYLMIGAEVYPIIFLDKHKFTFKICGVSYHEKKPWIILNPAVNQFDGSYGNWLHKAERDSGVLYFSFLSPPLVYTCRNDSFLSPLNTPINKITFNRLSQSVLTIPDFCLDGDTIWCTSWQPGLFWQKKMKDSIDYTTVKLPPIGNIHDVLSSVRVFSSQYIIASSASSGLYLVDKRSGQNICFKHSPQDPFSIASNKTTALYKDRTGIWWIGTTEGISKYDPEQWQFNTSSIIRDPDHDFTTFSLFEDAQHNLRICTSDGIYKRMPGHSDFQLFKFKSDGVDRLPTFIHPYGDGKFALCTEIAFFRYDLSREKISMFPVQPLSYPDNSIYNFQTYQVRSMISDTIKGDPVLCYAPLGWGMGLYDLKTMHYYYFLHDDSFPHPIGNNLSRKVVKDQNGVIWVATSGGLYRWNGKDFLSNDFTGYLHTPGDSTTLSSNDVQDLYVDKNNHLWLATNGGGLDEFDGKKFTCFRAPLPQSNSMFGIYADDSDRFWLPSAAGFEVFSLKSKEYFHVAIPDPSLFLKPPTHILQSSGLMIYAAGNYLVSFRPDSFQFNEKAPEIYLTDFKILNQSHWQDVKKNALNYAHDENFFTISFSSLQLSGPGKPDYQYKLDGLDNQWVSTQTGTAIYTSLPPGHYSFEVKAANGVGVWSESVKLISFTVNAPWWTRWWFFVLSSAAVTLITYLIVSYRIRHLMKIQLIRNRIANDLHDDVGSALSTISLYSEVAKMKAGAEKDLEEILDKISATSQEMQENMNYIVWSIQPRNDQFDQMILRIKQYAIEMLQPKNIHVHFSIDEKLHTAKLTTEQRKDLFLIFKEAVHNITKYAECGSVQISFMKSNHTVEMIIRDDGIGFEISGESAGNGLYTMKERAASLNGSLSIYSEISKGTSVYLSFRL